MSLMAPEACSRGHGSPHPRRSRLRAKQNLGLGKKTAPSPPQPPLRLNPKGFAQRTLFSNTRSHSVLSLPPKRKKLTKEKKPKNSFSP